MILTEQSVIGSVLLDPRCLPTVRKYVKTADFEDERAQRIFTTICRLADSGSSVDVVPVAAEAGKDCEAFILEAMQATPTAANAEAYAEALSSESMSRKTYTLIEQATERLFGGESYQFVCAELKSGLDALTEGHRTRSLISGSESILSLMEHRQLLESGKAPMPVATGYRQLDKLLGGGMIREGLYILAARPAVGKTTLALNIAAHVSDANKKCLFVSLEMSVMQLDAKLLAIQSGVSSWRILYDPHLTDDEIKRLNRAAEKCFARPVFYNRLPGVTVDDIGFMARQIEGLELVVIDYLGLIRATEGRSLYEKTTAISQALKRLARTLNVPILCLAQLNREATDGKAPTMADIRDSGAIEQDADAVMLVHQLSDSEDGISPACTQIILAKNRHGATGKVDLNFYKTVGRILE